MKTSTKIVGAGLATALVAGPGLFVHNTWKANHLPEDFLPPVAELPAELSAENETAIMTANGQTLGKLATSTIKSSFDYQELQTNAPHVTQAVIATEDARFHTNGGCDVQGIYRAVTLNSARGIMQKLGVGGAFNTQGASTIPRQLVSERFVQPTAEQLRADVPVVRAAFELKGEEYARQVYECRVAMKLVQEKGPDWVLNEYLNTVYWGRGAYTIEDAAQAYFGVRAAELSKKQAAVLAGTLRQPSRVDMDYTQEQTGEDRRELHDQYIYSLSRKLLVDAELAKDGKTPADAPKEEVDKLYAELDPEEVQERQLKITSDEFKTGLEQLQQAKALTETQVAQIKTYRDAMQEWTNLTNNTAHVINKMEENGYITSEEAEQMRAEEIVLAPYIPRPAAKNDFSGANQHNARHFTDFALREAKVIFESQNMDPEKLADGYVITTTLNTDFHDPLVNTIRNQDFIQSSQLDMAAADVHQTGAILGMYGGKDYQTSQFNLAVDGRRSNGSQNKPFALAVELMNGGQLSDEYQVKQESIVHGADDNSDKDDLPIIGNDGCDHLNPPQPKNCTMNQRQGLAASSNYIAGLNVEKNGVGEVAELMEALGTKVPRPITPSLILGTEVSTLGLATGYNNLVANRGAYVAPYSIVRIATKEGAIVYERPQPEPKQIIEVDSVAADTIDAMTAVVQEGTAAGKIETPKGPQSVAGKTGTGTKKDNLGFTGTACDAKLGAHTISLWAGNPERNERIPDSLIRSSGAIAGIFGRIIAQQPQTPEACNLVDNSIVAGATN